MSASQQAAHDFLSRFWVVWDARWKVAAGAAACAVITGILGMLLPAHYQTSITVLVAPPTFKEAIPDATQTNPYTPRSLATLMPSPLPVETYRVLAQSPDLLDEIIQSLELPMRISQLRDDISVELIQLGSRTPQFGTTYSDALVLTVTADTPERAAQIAQRWAELLVARAEKIASENIDKTVALVDTMYDSSRKTLAGAEKDLETFQKQWNLDLLEKEKLELEKLVAELRVELERTELDIAKNQKLLETARAQLAEEPRIDTLFRAPTDDVYWLSKQQSGGESPLGPKDGLRTEVFNPQYEEIKKSEIQAEQTLEAALAARADLTSRIENVTEQIDKIQRDLAEQRIVDTRLKREIEIQEDAFNLVARSRERAKFAQASRDGDLYIAGRAVELRRPVGLPLPVKIGLAAVLGALLVGAYFVLQFELRLLADRRPALTT